MSRPIPVILSGDAGSQLWPLSRELMPKQLLRLAGEHTPLQQTALRLGQPPLIVCNFEHRFVIAEQMREIGITPLAMIIEPVGRNTAPAATVAALMLATKDPDALMLIMPSDHMLGNPVAFQAAIELAIPLASAGRMVAFGVTPTSPNTSYGYIKAEAGEHEIDNFVEKPSLAAAEDYLRSGDYLWNSGIFLVSAGLYLEEMQTHAPDMLAACRLALDEGQSDLFFFSLDNDAFSGIQGQSIDRVVMERSNRLAVVQLDFGWSDIGSWSSLWDEAPKDTKGNALIGDVTALNSTGCYIRSQNQLVAGIGLKNLVVMVTDDAVLVADRSHDQDVAVMVATLKGRGRPEVTQGKRGWRPWGWFETIEEGLRFKVKQIHVEPGAKLSLQKHWHRSEHWVVVKGTALVTCGDKEFVLRENESTFIPATIRHRLENPGKVPLLLIEVQSGEYVGEDDIVRLEDIYGRDHGCPV